MIRVRDAADLLGVSDDTVRRWIDDGTLPADQDQSGRKVIPGEALARFAVENSGAAPKDPLSIASSARNRFTGLVTKVDAARDLKLEPGSLAVAVVKATTVIVETPGGQS